MLFKATFQQIKQKLLTCS